MALKKHHEVEVTVPVTCDFCAAQGKGVVAEYDFKVAGTGTAWAYGCTRHFKQRGIGTGLGKGQRLIYVTAKS